MPARIFSKRRKKGRKEERKKNKTKKEKEKKKKKKRQWKTKQRKKKKKKKKKERNKEANKETNKQRKKKKFRSARNQCINISNEICIVSGLLLRDRTVRQNTFEGQQRPFTAAYRLEPRLPRADVVCATRYGARDMHITGCDANCVCTTSLREENQYLKDLNTKPKRFKKIKKIKICKPACI